MKNGHTLIEVLTALTITGLVVVLATRIFLPGHAESILRSRESGLLREGLLLQWEFERKLQSDSMPVFELKKLQTRFPHLDSISLQPFKIDAAELLPVMLSEKIDLWTWTLSFSWGKSHRELKGSCLR